MPFLRYWLQIAEAVAGHDIEQHRLIGVLRFPVDRHREFRYGFASAVDVADLGISSQVADEDDAVVAASHEFRVLRCKLSPSALESVMFPQNVLWSAARIYNAAHWDGVRLIYANSPKLLEREIRPSSEPRRSNRIRGRRIVATW